MVFTNAHAHSPVANTLTIVQSDLKADFFSEGVHPVLDAEHATQKLEELILLAESGQLTAVGECGFDKDSPLSTDRRLGIFLDQIAIAEKYRLPVIVHCVGRWNELEKVIRLHPHQLFVLHGFRKMKLISQLCFPNVYFSFGQAMTYDKNIWLHLNEIPRNRLLLETDDRDFDLTESYARAATLLGISYPETISLIESNFHRVFSAVERKQR